MSIQESAFIEAWKIFYCSNILQEEEKLEESGWHCSEKKPQQIEDSAISKFSSWKKL